MWQDPCQDVAVMIKIAQESAQVGAVMPAGGRRKPLVVSGQKVIDMLDTKS
jgi:hypothetical protein